MAENSEKFDYFRYDGVYYRRVSGTPGLGVRDIKRKAGWKPYDDDDLIAPVCYGTQVEQAEAEAP